MALQTPTKHVEYYDRDDYGGIANIRSEYETIDRLLWGKYVEYYNTCAKTVRLVCWYVHGRKQGTAIWYDADGFPEGVTFHTDAYVNGDPPKRHVPNAPAGKDMAEQPVQTYTSSIRKLIPHVLLTPMDIYADYHGPHLHGRKIEHLTNGTTVVTTYWKGDLHGPTTIYAADGKIMRRTYWYAGKPTKKKIDLEIDIASLPIALRPATHEPQATTQPQEQGQPKRPPAACPDDNTDNIMPTVHHTEDTVVHDGEVIIGKLEVQMNNCQIRDVTVRENINADVKNVNADVKNDVMGVVYTNEKTQTEVETPQTFVNSTEIETVYATAA